MRTWKLVRGPRWRRLRLRQAGRRSVRAGAPSSRVVTSVMAATPRQAPRECVWADTRLPEEGSSSITARCSFLVKARKEHSCDRSKGSYAFTASLPESFEGQASMLGPASRHFVRRTDERRPGLTHISVLHVNMPPPPVSLWLPNSSIRTSGNITDIASQSKRGLTRPDAESTRRAGGAEIFQRAAQRECHVQKPSRPC